MVQRNNGVMIAPEASVVTSTGKLNLALVAGPLSPVLPLAVPVPAMVVIIPVDTMILRTQ